MPVGAWSRMLAASQPVAEVNVAEYAPGIVKFAKSLGPRVPFLVTGALGGAWLVWPALTPEFKGRWGLGPKVEE
ncbi:Hypothetical Protein FCC1311_099192 [Hondaea fermentalgiana]|uniref:Uncharacterized protein n=1 Tax=Hondaea fermentalgiana TaxID=2315210 RepID=A0A2R5GS33_9STRA|nr:Hypothetical Protein FCC1311_099192 [Hondaea fermentalgiana]|eukprot:GBG33696.1 Hypothetical Protein FCC1311_099192 [Hondaea fermentalgiana]